MNTRAEYLQKEIPKIEEKIGKIEIEISNLEDELDGLKARLDDYESELFAVTDSSIERIKDEYYERIFTTDLPCNIVYLDLVEENPAIAKHHIKIALGR